VPSAVEARRFVQCRAESARETEAVSCGPAARAPRGCAVRVWGQRFLAGRPVRGRLVGEAALCPVAAFNLPAQRLGSGALRSASGATSPATRCWAALLYVDSFKYVPKCQHNLGQFQQQVGQFSRRGDHRVVTRLDLPDAPARFVRHTHKDTPHQRVNRPTPRRLNEGVRDR